MRRNGSWLVVSGWWSLVARVLLVLVVLASSAALIFAQAADEALNAGFAALDKNDADRAAAAFRRALAAEPEHPVALYGAGAAAFLQGRQTDAIGFLRRALQREPRL